MRQRFKVVVEKTEDGYVAYPLGLRGVVVSDGETLEQSLANVKRAIAFHIEAFGRVVLGESIPAEDIYLAEAEVAVDV